MLVPVPAVRSQDPASVSALRPCNSHAAGRQSVPDPAHVQLEVQCTSFSQRQQRAGQSHLLMARLERCMTSDFVRGLSGGLLSGCRGVRVYRTGMALSC